MRSFYLLLAIIGLLLPVSQFIPFVTSHGFDVPLMVDQLFANRISSSFALDLVVTAVAVIVFAVSESARLKVQHVWIAIAGTVLVGVSFGLPLFLYLRELNLTRQQTEALAETTNGRQG